MVGLSGVFLCFLLKMGPGLFLLTAACLSSREETDHPIGREEEGGIQGAESFSGQRVFFFQMAVAQKRVP